MYSNLDYFFLRYTTAMRVRFVTSSFSSAHRVFSLVGSASCQEMIFGELAFLLAIF